MKPPKHVRRLVARLLGLCEQLAVTKRELDRATKPPKRKARKGVPG